MKEICRATEDIDPYSVTGGYPSGNGSGRFDVAGSEARAEAGGDANCTVYRANFAPAPPETNDQPLSVTNTD
jgi:hypothetical protein